jgi:uncharacterized protein YggT (Ycf19 family)
MQSGRFYAFLREITAPLIFYARKIPHRWKMIDFSPIIAFFGIDILIFILGGFL